MELTIKGLARLYLPSVERRSRRKGLDLTRIHQADLARRAREHQEFLLRKRNLSNSVLNMPIL